MDRAWVNAVQLSAVQNGVQHVLNAELNGPKFFQLNAELNAVQKFCWTPNWTTRSVQSPISSKYTSISSKIVNAFSSKLCLKTLKTSWKLVMNLHIFFYFEYFLRKILVLQKFKLFCQKKIIFWTLNWTLNDSSWTLNWTTQYS